MAGRGPRSGGGRPPTDGARTGLAHDDALVRIHDLAGRPRGTGFVADHHGTVLTSHEAVDGLARLVLHAAGDRTCLVTADAVTPLPALDLALVRTEGLGVDPLPVTVRDRVETGTYVQIAAGCWREARVLGATNSVTYAATDRFHLLDDALELAIGTAGRDALRLGGGAAGDRSWTPRRAPWSASSAPRSSPASATWVSPSPSAPSPTAHSPPCSPGTRRRCPRTEPTSTWPAYWS